MFKVKLFLSVSVWVLARSCWKLIDFSTAKSLRISVSDVFKLSNKMDRGKVGRLQPYLEKGLKRNLYPNLQYESEEIFYIELIRYGKNKISRFEKILIGWYECTGKKYPGYSKAKAVFQAALKKSIFLVPLPTIGGKLRFRFASPKEQKEKKEALKLKMMKKEACNENDESSLPPNSPSVASSGYGSGCEEGDELMAVQDENSPRNDENLSSPRMIFEEEIKMQNGTCSLEEEINMQNGTCSLEEEIKMQNGTYSHEEEMNWQTHDYGGKIEYDNPLPQTIFQEEIKLDSFPDLEDLAKYLDSEDKDFEADFSRNLNNGFSSDLCHDASQSMPVEDNTQKQVESNAIQFYWQCTQKYIINEVLLFICKNQVLSSEDQGKGITNGSVYIPSEFWEPGKNVIDYNLEKFVEISDKYFCFFTPKCI